MLRVLSATLLLSSLTSAAKVGLFEDGACVDQKGMEQCYEDAASQAASCINDNCDGLGIDCHNVCTCIQVRAQIDCAGAHCWNQVHSCEYQETVTNIGDYCIKPDYSNIPFFPPPDNAPGSCSCNLGKVFMSWYKTTEETETCGANGEVILKQLTSNAQIQAFTKACQCCSMSGYMSAFWGFCPSTSPSEIGYNEIYRGLIANREELWEQCGDYMDAYPCGSNGMDWSPPGNNTNAKFYAASEIPANGTETLSNVAGSITSPVSGSSYTWTWNDNETRTIKVASADAKPTGNTDNGNNSDNGDKGEGSDNNHEDAAAVLVPRLVPLLVGVVAVGLL